MDRKKVYLAGPDVFLPDAAARGEALKALCNDAGFSAHFPLDGKVEGSSPAELAENIRRANQEAIAACDLVIANLSPFRGPEPDSGTVWEVGYAEGLGKAVFAYSTDTRLFKDKTIDYLNLAPGAQRDAGDMEIEDFGLTHNLMFARLVVAASFEDCLRIAKHSMD